MTRGTVLSYDEKHDSGYIMPDDEDDKIPFDRKSLEGFAEGDVPKEGDRVTLQIEGGMAGLWATHVKRIAESA